MVTKVGVARGLTAAYLLLQYRKEMEENYRKGDWAEAAKDTAVLGVTLTPVVAPNIFFGSIAFPVLTGVAIGTVTTMAIVEIAGIGTAEQVLDLVLDPPSPKEWTEVVQDELIQPAKKYVIEELWEEQLVKPVTGWVNRRIDELELVWSITRPRLLLPF